MEKRLFLFAPLYLQYIQTSSDQCVVRVLLKVVLHLKFKNWDFVFYVFLSFRTKKSRYLSSDGKKTTDSATYVKISLISKMDVTERFWSYGFVEWIAECGGFGGLFLGYSFSQIGDFIELVTVTFKKYLLK